MDGDDDILGLVERALELDADGRLRLLDDLGRRRPDLRQELEVILEGEDDLETEYLEAPAVEDMAGVFAWAEKETGQPFFPEHPESIGPYEVLELLGEGGMGRVYLARQTEPVERRVAIKLIRAGLNSPGAAARFDAERQAMARLSHPAVATIWESGTSEGFPYFVMEHVDGAPLIKFCDAERLEIDERLELFVRICRGVEHAHQKGILHRDLKPSNILVARVDGEPAPKIIDFGIAKAFDDPLTDQTLLTRFGIGTPNYMSPEAFGTGIDVDTRTDIYALGILLHQLLNGTLPLDTRELSASQVADHITRGDPPLPSRSFADLDSKHRDQIAAARKTGAEALTRRLRGDLDWIVRRATEGDKEHRYGSARELGDDVRRHLDLEPVSAGPPSRTYRANRWVRRNPSVAAGLAVALFSLLFGIVGTTLGMVEARREARRAELEVERTQEALADAEASTDFLIGLFEVSDPREAGGETVTARALLGRGEEHIERRFADRPLRRAELLQSLGEIHVRLHQFGDARRLMNIVVELRRSALPEDHPKLSEAQKRLREIESLGSSESKV